MATYYKYAERDASSQVNWAEISSNMVNSLNEAQAIRDSKRKAIDDATTELGTTLSEAPQGEHRGINEFAMNYANNAQEMRLMQDKLLKSGQLKLRDYNVGRANLTQGTTQLFNLSKKYQSMYEDGMKYVDSGIGSVANLALWGRAEAFMNFTNNEAYIDPTNGQVSIGKLIDTKIDDKTVRTMDKTPGSFTSVLQMHASLDQRIDKYQIDTLYDRLDKWEASYAKTFGPNLKITDIRQNPEYKDALKEFIKGQLAGQSNTNAGSVLLDYMGVNPETGNEYKIVYDPKEVDEDSILMIADPAQPGSGRMVFDYNAKKKIKVYDNPKFKNIEDGNKFRAWVNKTHPDEAKNLQLDETGSYNNKYIQSAIDKYGKEYAENELKTKPRVEEVNIGQKQMEAAEEHLNTQAELLFGRDETKTQPREGRDYTERNNRYKQEDYQVSNIGLLMTGDETQVQTAIDYFRDLNEATKKVIRTPNGIEVTFKNNDGILETRDISFYVGEGKNKKAKTVAQFIESASNLLTGKSNDGIRTILERGNYDKDATFNEKLTEDYIAEVNTQAVDKGFDMEAIDKKLNEDLFELDFYGEDETMQVAIKDKFKDDFDLIFTPIDNDKFIIDAAGYEGSVTIEGDFMGISNVEGEKERRKLKAFMKTLYEQKYIKNKSKTNTGTGNKRRRTIAQIMKEENVNMPEATKIFNTEK